MREFRTGIARQRSLLRAERRFRCVIQLMTAKYTLGLDYGTNSVRALIVDTSDGREVATAVWDYEHGEAGVILSRDPNLARQHPADYLKGAEISIRGRPGGGAQKVRGFRPEQVAGIGVDTTGSTPLPVDGRGQPLAFARRFARHPAAMAWLWKDHTGVAEAGEITALARKCGPSISPNAAAPTPANGSSAKYSIACAPAPRFSTPAASWIELADFIPAALTGTEAPDKLTVGVCAAGHKAMYNESWGGYPDAGSSRLSPKLGALRAPLVRKAATSAPVRRRTDQRLGAPHRLARGPAGGGRRIRRAPGRGRGRHCPGTLVKIIGTSTCDIAVWPLSEKLADIPGLCGIVSGSVLPGLLRAGGRPVRRGRHLQLVRQLYSARCGKKAGSHEALTGGGRPNCAGRIRPARAGLEQRQPHRPGGPAPDRSAARPDPLHHPGGDLSRARSRPPPSARSTIINRFEEYGVKVPQVVNCGGIAEKNPLVMQIYADVTGRPMKVSRSAQTCALGAAIAAAVVAGAHGGFSPRRIKAMTGLKPRVFAAQRPRPTPFIANLYSLYIRCMTLSARPAGSGNLYPVMKQLIDIRNRARA